MTGALTRVPGETVAGSPYAILQGSLANTNLPVLVAAFQGWNDGGQAATLAGGYLARLWKAERFADIDPEGFVDFQSSRPRVASVSMKPGANTFTRTVGANAWA